MQDKNAFWIIAILWGAVAVVTILRGLITIIRREGPLMRRGKKYIAHGKYAVCAGIGQLFIGLAYVLLIFSFSGQVPFFIPIAIFLLGTVIHFAIGYRDPDVRSQIEEQYRLANQNDNDLRVIRNPDWIKKRYG